MKVFSESEGTTKSMEKRGVSVVCIRDMTTSWHGPHPLDKGGFANKLFDQASLHNKSNQFDKQLLMVNFAIQSLKRNYKILKLFAKLHK